MQVSTSFPRFLEWDRRTKVSPPHSVGCGIRTISERPALACETTKVFVTVASISTWLCHWCVAEILAIHEKFRARHPVQEGLLSRHGCLCLMAERSLSSRTVNHLYSYHLVTETILMISRPWPLSWGWVREAVTGTGVRSGVCVLSKVQATTNRFARTQVIASSTSEIRAWDATVSYSRSPLEFKGRPCVRLLSVLMSGAMSQARLMYELFGPTNVVQSLTWPVRAGIAFCATGSSSICKSRNLQTF